MNCDSEVIWQNIVESLENIIDNEGITFLRALVLRNNNEQWQLVAANKFALKRISESYLPVVKIALKKYDINKINLIIEEFDLFTAPKIKKEQQLESKNTLNSEYQFSNFVCGPSNEQAYISVKRVTNSEDKFPMNINPLLIYGGTGVGKSHLMHAAGNALRARGKKKVLYITAEDFVNEVVATLKSPTRNMQQFADIYRNVDALLIDDIQFLGGNKTTSQAEFFHTFNSLFNNNRQIILTSDRFPKEIDGLEERLKSRFGCGLTVSIAPPELETRVAILKSKAALAQFALPQEIAFYIATKITTNVRDLEGALKNFFALSNYKNESTIAIAVEAIRDCVVAQKKQITIENIQEFVANHYHISTVEINSDSRQRTLAHPRQVAMALAKELTSHSLIEIGKAFGGRDHSTVIHACKKIEMTCKQNSQFEEEYNEMRMNIIG